MVSHPVHLRGYGAAPLEDHAPPAFVKRTDEDFLDGVLQGLGRGATAGELGAPDRALASGRLRLYQPIHRTFNVVALEAVCDRPGRPRVNPRQIESAGLVVRRLRDLNDPSRDEAWQKSDREIFGWRGLENIDAWRLDPDPLRRSSRTRAMPPAVQAILGRLRLDLEPPGESVAPMFVAPPEICESSGKTLLYGTLPVTSAEQRDQRPPETVDEVTVNSLMPEFLRTATGNYRPNGEAATVSAADAQTAEEGGSVGTLGLFILGLRTLQSVLRVFTEPDAGGFLALLNAVQIQVSGGPTALGTYLAGAVDVLIDRRKEGLSILVPEVWPFPDAGFAGAFVREGMKIMNARLAQQPRSVKRFEDPDAVYRVHAFVRMRCAEGCPSEIHWSAPSEPFQIVPWWEGGGPVPTITMPDFNRDALKALKPSVAFALPPALANLINRSDPKKLRDGEASTGGLELGCLCSFSLPVITLCAFIVLNIFLSLFDLIFQWKLFIKICLPIPKNLLPPKP